MPVQVAAVAVLCVQPEPSYRPLITDVLHSLVPLVPADLGGTLRVTEPHSPHQMHYPSWDVILQVSSKREKGIIRSSVDCCLFCNLYLTCPCCLRMSESSSLLLLLVGQREFCFGESCLILYLFMYKEAKKDFFFSFSVDLVTAVQIQNFPHTVVSIAFERAVIWTPHRPQQLSTVLLTAWEIWLSISDSDCNASSQKT